MTTASGQNAVGSGGGGGGQVVAATSSTTASAAQSSQAGGGQTLVINHQGQILSLPVLQQASTAASNGNLLKNKYYPQISEI